MASSDLGDPILVLLDAGQRRQAIARCARDHGHAIGRLCMAMLGDQGEAEEAAQETLLAAYDAFDGFRRESSLRAWLLGIARRLCARRLAKRVRRERRLRLIHHAGEGGSLPDDIVVRRREADRVRSALETLKPSDREALLLRYESGLSHREIATLCDLDEPTVRKRTSRALARLRDAFSATTTEESR